MSERKAKAKTNADNNRKRKNNFGKGTQLRFGRNAEAEKEQARRESRRAGIAGAVTAFIVMALIAGGGGYALERFDKQEIPETVLPIRVVDAPDPVLDTELVKRSYAYTTAAENAPDDSLLTVGGGSIGGRMQPVYNAIFSKEGLQIASLADRSMKCGAEAVNPLAEMLGAFYAETGLRTVMINSACAEDGTEAQTGYLFEFGQYIKDSDSRRPFTLEGKYSWFTEHSHEYGFIQRYPRNAEELTGVASSEAIFRYVGKTAAQIMHDNALCLEQLEQFMKPHTLDDPIIMGDEIVYSQPAERIAISAEKSGALVPFELYYLGSEGKTVLVIERPTEEFYYIPEPESENIVYR